MALGRGSMVPEKNLRLTLVSIFLEMWLLLLHCNMTVMIDEQGLSAGSMYNNICILFSSTTRVPCSLPFVISLVSFIQNILT